MDTALPACSPPTNPSPRAEDIVPPEDWGRQQGTLDPIMKMKTLWLSTEAELEYLCERNHMLPSNSWEKYKTSDQIQL